MGSLPPLAPDSVYPYHMPVRSRGSMKRSGIGRSVTGFGRLTTLTATALGELADAVFLLPGR